MATKQIPLPELVEEVAEIAEAFTSSRLRNGIVRACFPDTRMKHMRTDLDNWLKEVGADLSAIALKVAEAAEVYAVEETPEPAEAAPDAPKEEGGDKKEDAPAEDAPAAKKGNGRRSRAKSGGDKVEVPA